MDDGAFFFYVFPLPRQVGPRAYQAHFSEYDVKYLRQLVQRGFAQEIAHPGYAGVVAQFPVFFPFLFNGLVAVEELLQAFLRVGEHGAELVAVKLAGVPADALLAENGGAFGVQFYDKGYQQHRRQEDHEDDHAGQIVQEALGAVFKRVSQIVAHLDDDGLLPEEMAQFGAGYGYAFYIRDKEGVFGLVLYVVKQFYESVFLQLWLGHYNVVYPGAFYIAVYLVYAFAHLVAVYLGRPGVVVDEPRYFVAQVGLVSYSHAGASGRRTGTYYEDLAAHQPEGIKQALVVYAHEGKKKYVQQGHGDNEGPGIFIPALHDEQHGEYRHRREERGFPGELQLVPEGESL